MDPREFSKLASRLVASDEPASLRSAISRAYYGAYHVAKEFLADRAGFGVQTGQYAHENVQTCLCNSGDDEVREAGTMLGSLHSMRIRADYHLSNGDVQRKATAESHVEDARDIVRVLDACARDPRRLAVIARTLRESRVTRHLTRR